MPDRTEIYFRGRAEPVTVNAPIDQVEVQLRSDGRERLETDAGSVISVNWSQVLFLESKEEPDASDAGPLITRGR
jgi:hypothetical protein